MHSIARSAVLACTLLTAGCETERPAPSASEFESWVAERYVAPFRAGEAERWADAFADNAVALHNRRDADVGKDAILAFGRLVAETFEVSEMDVQIEEVRVNGDWAFTRGVYTNEFRFRETGQPTPWGRERGKFFMLWERQADGEWRIIVDMGNSAAPSAPSAQ
jgi:ketosteroid isomerase-like protein